MTKTVSDLREHLFATLDGLRSGSVSIETARAISEVSQTIINSAKVEVEYAKVSGADSSTFLAAADDDDQVRLPAGVTGITRHRLRG
jgi:hypothetical protein